VQNRAWLPLLVSLAIRHCVDFREEDPPIGHLFSKKVRHLGAEDEAGVILQVPEDQLLDGGVCGADLDGFQLEVVPKVAQTFGKGAGVFGSLWASQVPPQSLKTFLLRKKQKQNKDRSQLFCFVFFKNFFFLPRTKSPTRSSLSHLSRGPGQSPRCSHAS